MKNSFKIFSIIMLSLVMALTMAACNSSKSVDEEMEEAAGITEEMDAEEAAEKLAEEEAELYDNGIMFDEEMEGTELHFKSVEAKDFFGSWEATSGQSIYMYGNVDIKITSDGKWSGNITDEEVQGTWEFKNPTLSLKSELWNLSLSFTDDGKLIMQEEIEDSDEPLNTVLTKK